MLSDMMAGGLNTSTMLSLFYEEIVLAKVLIEVSLAFTAVLIS